MKLPLLTPTNTTLAIGGALGASVLGGLGAATAALLLSPNLDHTLGEYD